MQSRSIRRAFCALPLVLLISGGLVWAQKINPWQNKQTPPIKLGTSGGNVNDISHAFCCSGTLGSLVTIGSTQYILSNNHVLADTDTASPGDAIIQPGLVDVSCNASNAQVVANFTRASTLGTQNVDAAIAQVVPGEVDSGGAILGIGTVASAEATPTIGLAVAKSGRTTQVTCASISTTNTDVSVQYQQGCGSGKKFVITYTNQIVINSSSFSAAGDSGSLIVEQQDASGIEPVGLLYAGSSTTTIANPIGEVTAALGVSFPNSSKPATSVTCPTSGGGGGGGGHPHGPAGVSRGSFGRALAAKNNYAASLMADPAILGVGVGAGSEDPSQAVVVIYLEQGRMHGPIPTMLDGVRTEVIRTDAIRAYGWNEPERKACTVR